MKINMELLRRQVNEVIKYSQNIDGDVDSTELLNKWYSGKLRFFQKFNNDSLIYESPNTITVKLPDEEKHKQVTEFYNLIRDHYTGNNFNYYGLKDFLIENEECLYENKVGYSRNSKIPEGMKISKAMKFFVDDKELLDTFQTALSRMIQEEKITGTLCFSVHPLDYLSLSENAHNWRSCHALDGDYRAGNLAYMIDSSTIVCYLKTTHELEKLPHFPYTVPWNSKKWRMLLFVSEKNNGLFAGRHYPFFSEVLMDECKRIFLSQSNNPGWEEWTAWHNDSIKRIEFESHNEDSFSFNERIFMNGTVSKKKSLMTSSPDDLHFNDLLKSSCYKPYYAWRTWPQEKSMFFTIGDKPVPCCKCGKGTVKMTDAMICNDCLESDDYHCTCYECGDLIREDDAYYIDHGGFYVCESCFSNYYGYCSHCEETYNLDDLIYDERDSCYYCPDCYQEVMENRGEN